MEQRGNMVQATTAWERFLHWLLVVPFIFLFVTGFGFMFHQMNWIQTVLGGGYMARSVHNWAGLIFFIAVILSILTWARECLRFDSDDVKWITKGGGYLGKVEDLPESGRFNAGQKGFYLVIIIFSLVISWSGWIMWNPTAHAVGTVNVAYALHALSMVVLSLCWVAHWYLGTIANPGTFSSMSNGWVTKGWAKKQHGKWYKETFEA